MGQLSEFEKVVVAGVRAAAIKYKKTEVTLSVEMFLSMADRLDNKKTCEGCFHSKKKFGTKCIDCIRHPDMRPDRFTQDVEGSPNEKESAQSSIVSTDLVLPM